MAEPWLYASVIQTPRRQACISTEASQDLPAARRFLGNNPSQERRLRRSRRIPAAVLSASNIGHTRIRSHPLPMYAEDDASSSGHGEWEIQDNSSLRAARSAKYPSNMQNSGAGECVAARCKRRPYQRRRRETEDVVGRRRLHSRVAYDALGRAAPRVRSEERRV